MEIQVRREDLVRELGLADRIISRKNAIPICGSVLLKADASGATVASTDTELGLTARLPATVKQQGMKAIQAAKLFELVKSLPEGDVTLGESGDQAVLAGAGFRARLAAFAAVDFPALAQPEGQFATLPGDVLAELIGRVRFATAAAGKESYFLNGALMEISDTNVRMVATDSHRLSLADAAVQSAANGHVPTLVPLKTLAMLAGMLEGYSGAVEYTATANHLFFRVGERLLLSRQVEGKFPAYARMVPARTAHKATLARVPFADALRRIQVLDSHRRAAFHFSAGALKLSAKSAEVGDGEEVLACGYDGPELTMGLNAGYVLDFLESVGAETVEFEAQSAQAVAVFRPAGGAGLYLVMPMSL